MSIIYHYCSVKTFKKIIESRTFWFSDVLKSNDPKEIIYLWEKYYEYIEKIASPSAVKAIEYMMDSQLEENIFLTFCCSKEPDALHMWNCYADGGVAIGLDSDKILEWLKGVCYYTKHIRENLEKEHGIIAENGAVCTEIKEIDYYDANEIDKYIADKCKNIEFASGKFGEVFFEAPFSKNKFFEIEKEVRILIRIFKSMDNSNLLEYIDDKTNESTTIKLGSSSNRWFDNVIIAEVPFPEEIIESITIGPNCKLSTEDVQQILYVVNDYKNSIKIKKSEGSLR